MNQKFKDCLLEVYHAEQAGEIIFESLVKNAKNRDELFIFGSMLQLETEAKAIMRPTLIKLDLSIEENPISRNQGLQIGESFKNCLLYTSPSPRDRQKSRMPSSA